MMRTRDRLPDFMIIGAQRSASTTVMRHLGDHPQINLPILETPYFRDPWYKLQDPSVLVDATRTAKLRVRRFGIKSADALGSPECAERIRLHLGDIQLIATLRNPVDRAISSYFWGMQWGWLPLMPPNEGIPLLLHGQLETDFPRAGEILEYGKYARHLRRFHALFSDSNIRVYLDSDFKDNFRPTLADLCKFLGVDTPSREYGRDEKHVNGGVYSMKRIRFLRLRTRHIFREFDGYKGKYLQPAKGPWGRSVNRTVSIVDRLILSRLMDNTRPLIEPHISECLYGYYKNDIEELEQLLRRDLSSWKITRQIV